MPDKFSALKSALMRKPKDKRYTDKPKGPMSEWSTYQRQQFHEDRSKDTGLLGTDKPEHLSHQSAIGAEMRKRTRK